MCSVTLDLEYRGPKRVVGLSHECVGMFMLLLLLLAFPAPLHGTDSPPVITDGTLSLAYQPNVSSGQYVNQTNHSKNANLSGHGSHSGGIQVAGIHYHEVRDPLIFTIVVLIAGLSKIGFHHADFLSSRIPESCILIILGTVFGAIIHFTGLSSNLPKFFKPHEFFMFLLPPIILEAAFSLYDRTFTENFGSILLFAVVGTILACLLLGVTLYGLAQAGAMGTILELSFVEIMVFSSLIVAVDPVAVLAVFNEIGVNQVLYFLVFGESLLNDGVTVVLYKVFQAYNVMEKITGIDLFLGLVKFLVVCLGGAAVGISAGLATALLTKYSTHVKVAQPIIIFSMAYFGYLMAELFGFSGIISIIGCGLFQMQYAFHNISDKSRTTIKYFTKVISSTNEIIIFMFLGLAMINDEHEWHTGFTLWTILLCLVFRFLITFGLSFLINWLDIYRVRKITLHEQFMIAYGGLRGAVCFSLVVLLDGDLFKAQDMFVTTTLAVVIFTVFVQGITIKPLVRFLRIGLAPEKCRTMYKELNEHVNDHLMAGIEGIIGDHGKHHLREKLEKLDSKYFRPLLQVAPDPRDASLNQFYENLLLKEHYNYLQLSGAKTAEVIPNLPHVNTHMLLSSLLKNYSPENATYSCSEVEPCSPTPKDTEVILRRPGNITHPSSVPSPTGDIDAQGLHDLLHSRTHSGMILSKYDKNLTTHDGQLLEMEIRKRSNKNRRLERLFSEDGAGSSSGHRLSWSEQDAQICEQREHQRDKLPPRHAMTMNLAKVSRQAVLEPLDRNVSPPISALSLNAVFEEDESSATEPMLHEGSGIKRSGRKNSKHRLERQNAQGQERTDVEGNQGGSHLNRQEEIRDPELPLVEVVSTPHGAGIETSEGAERKKSDGGTDMSKL